MAQQCPGDPGKFAGQGDHSDIPVDAPKQRAEPISHKRLRLLVPKQHGSRAVNQLPSQILIAPLADAQQLGHERIAYLTSADVYFGRGQTILLERERIKRQTIQSRRLMHSRIAA
jgi:hypothetical protein